MSTTQRKFSLTQALLAISLVALALSACECDPVGLNRDPDVIVPDVIVPPPPPVFPLKAGDVLTLPAVQGRTEPCDGIEGSCDRAVRATYTITDVSLDEDLGRFAVEADYIYELVSFGTEAQSLGALFSKETVPFSLAEGGNDAGNAVFHTDASPTDQINQNGFPFFSFEVEYAGQEGSAYDIAAAEFRDRILDLDPSAEVENQSAEGKFEAYFKDERGASPMLHQVRVDLHPMGFICGFDEKLIPWQDSFSRRDSDFNGAGTPPLVGSVVSPIRIARDGVRYVCTCANLEDRTCRANVDGANVCLDPTDPNAAPGPCP